MIALKRRIAHRKNLIYTYDGTPPAAPSLPPGFEIVRATTEILEASMQDPELESRKERYIRFIDAGLVGYLALHEGQWAAAGWIALPEIPRYPGQIPDNFNAKYYWLFEAHTYAPFRGLGLHKALVVARLRYLASMNNGIVQAVADVNPNNTPSRRSYERLGFEESGIMDIWTLSVPRVRREPFGIWRKKAVHPPILAERPENK